MATAAGFAALLWFMVTPAATLAGGEPVSGTQDLPTLLGQTWPPYQPVDETNPHAIERGPGDYLAWWKIALLIVAFVVWLKSADWINRDACEMQEITGLKPELINPINLVVFLFAFFLAITVPWFFVGYPLFMIGAGLPFVIYVMIRNGRVEPDEKAFASSQWIKRAMRGQVYKVRDKQVAAEIGPEIDFAAAGETGEKKQSNLIRARQAEHFIAVKSLIYDAIEKRASQLLLNYTKEAVQVRMEVDGFWHDTATLDRPTGDSMLQALKFLGNLNPADRRSQQNGRFVAIIELRETPCQISTQGVATGEKALIKIAQTYADQLTLAQIGMWPDSAEALTNALNAPGITIISAPPGAGLSTTWQGTMTATDRIMRDCIALVRMDESETVIENVARHDLIENGQGDVAALSSLLLRNPEVYILPEIPDNVAFLNTLIDHAAQEDRCLIIRVAANTAVEAVLRVMQKTTKRAELARCFKIATCQRLVRRLCENCKQPLPANPNFLKQLGAQPRDEVNVCGPYKMPPPEQRVDEKGNPIEIPPCKVCGGLGYIGRIAVVETLQGDEAFQAALMADPKLDKLTQLARQRGNLSMLAQGYRLVLAGITSLQEVQRVLQPKKS